MKRALSKIESAYVIHNPVDKMWIKVSISYKFNLVNVNKKCG